MEKYVIHISFFSIRFILHIVFYPFARCHYHPLQRPGRYWTCTHAYSRFSPSERNLDHGWGMQPWHHARMAFKIYRLKGDYDSLQVMHDASLVTSINYWRNCAEVFWLPWNIWSDIWLQDDLRRILFRFKSSFSKTWYLEAVVASFPMINCFFWDSIVVLSCPFISTVLQCAIRLHTNVKLLDRVVSGAGFLTGGLFECDNAHRRSQEL